MSILRAPYRAADLRRLLQPASVALVGASADPRSLGGRALANLRGFGGRLHLVNPRRSEIDGRPCRPSVADLPEPPDCVVLAIPMEQTEAVLLQCAAAGAGAAVVFASGYAETGTPEGQQAQQRLAAIATATGLRLVGPNCVGVANRGLGLQAAFAGFPAHEDAPGRRIGLVSQSGALGLALSQAAERGVCFSHVLSCGNSCDVDVADFVMALAEDPGCDAIALGFEGLQEPARLAPALQFAVVRGRPVAFCPVGISAAGREAVRFHTATLAADLASLRGLRVAAIESLVEAAVLLAKAGRPVAPGVAVLSASGGTGILAVDAAASAGVVTPQPGPATVQRLRAALPAFAAARNPCDATAQATRHPESMLAAADALLADECFGALVVPWGRSQDPAVLDGIAELAAQHGKPACIVWTPQFPLVDVFRRIEASPSLVLFQSMRGCFDALAGWMAPITPG